MLLLTDSHATDVATCGAKAATLAGLVQAFAVPRGFVVLVDEPLDETILKAFDTLEAEKVAVRSSAMNEDGKEAAWAGQLETFLNVGREELLSAINKCRQSNGSERAASYAAAQGISAGNVAVIVQEMIFPSVSGVAFTKHPVTGENTVVVEAVRGLGESLVSGHSTPDTYVENGEYHLAGEVPIMGEQELQEVFMLAKRVRSALGYEVDIEWAFEHDKLYLLQARPITTL
jgi:pyruvate,water dikinase